MSARPIFEGSFVELVTPFACGSLDERAYREMIDWHIAEGTDGLVSAAGAGESATLTHDEHRLLVEWAVDQSRSRIPVIAGAVSNSTSEAIALSIEAERAGADAVLVATPYYNKPTQEGLYRHFKAVTEAIGIPVIIENDPGRSVADLSIETLKRLIAFENIVGIKDATASVARVTSQRLAIGTAFAQFCGEDASALGFRAHGGHGCFSTTSNVAPRLCAEFQQACGRNDYRRARALHDRLMPLHRALAIDSSPAPVKYALSLLGKCAPALRAPLLPAPETAQLAVRQAMMQAGLLN